MTKLSKPLRRTTEAHSMPHGFRKNLVVTLYPGAILGVRESRSHDEVVFDIGDLYARSLVQHALTARRSK